MLFDFFKKCDFLVKWWIFSVIANFALMFTLSGLVSNLDKSTSSGNIDFLKSSEWITLYIIAAILLIATITEIVKSIQAYKAIKDLILRVKENHIRMILEKERKLLLFIMLAPLLSIIIFPFMFLFPICSAVCKVLFWKNLNKVKHIVNSYSKE